MIIIIAEKPDQGAKIAAPFPHKKKQGYIEIAPADLFPQGAIVTWAVGHLCELAEPEKYDPAYQKWLLGSLPIIPDRFKHQVIRSKSKQFSLIKSLTGRPDVQQIIIASDAGREGEYIVRILLQLIGVKKPLKRLWISSLTPRAVRGGFEHLLDESETRALFYEAMSRSCADWLIGINCSRVYSLLFQQRGVREVFSLGRVQSPTLALIVAREKEIRDFQSEPFWETAADFDVEGRTYRGIWWDGRETRLRTRQEAEQIAASCQGKTAIIKDIKTERKEFQPPLFFNLSALQSTANQLFHFSPEQTLNILQQLYLSGFISYPRSDAQVVTPEEAKLFPGILQQLGRFDNYRELLPPPRASIQQNKRYVNAAKVSDHYAIVPTEQVPDITRLSSDERKLYDLIVRRLIAAYYDEAVFAYTQVITSVGEHQFLSKGTQLLQEGWRKVIFAVHAEKSPTAGEEEDDSKQRLPAGLQTGQNGIVQKIEVREGKTHPPKRYTEGQLITLMKTAGKSLDNEQLEKVLERTQGLGTEATRAGIIAVLKERGYIQVRKNLVHAAPKGIMLVEALGDSILSSAEMTAKWEQRLHEIGQGSASPQQFLEQVKKLTAKLVEAAIQQQSQWSFSVSPAPPHTPPAKSRRSNAGRSSKRSGVRQTAAASHLTAEFSSVGSCKICGADVIERDKFFACANSPSCRFSISKRILGKSVSRTNVMKLLKGGETAVIKGFKKGDKQFDAALKWDEQAKTIKFAATRANQ